MNKDVTLSDGSIVTVKKLALGKFGELILAFENGFAKFKNYPDMGKMGNNDFIALIPRILNDMAPEVEKVLHMIADIPADYELGIDEATDLLVALIETNDIAKIFNNIKKLMALKSAQPTQSNPSTNGSSSEPTSSPVNTDGAAAAS